MDYWEYLNKQNSDNQFLGIDWGSQMLFSSAQYIWTSEEGTQFLTSG